VGKIFLEFFLIRSSWQDETRCGPEFLYHHNFFGEQSVMTEPLENTDAPDASMYAEFHKSREHVRGAAMAAVHAGIYDGVGEETAL
jgi:hypothetical protein